MCDGVYGRATERRRKRLPRLGGGFANWTNFGYFKTKHKGSLHFKKTIIKL